MGSTTRKYWEVFLLVFMINLIGFSWANVDDSAVVAPLVTENIDGEESLVLYNDAKTIYANSSMSSIYLSGLEVEEKIVSSEGARIQLIDSEGNIVGQTANMDVYSWSSSFSGILYFFDTLPVGNYYLQLVYGDVESMNVVRCNNYILTVVDAPIIMNGSITGLKYGIKTAKCSLTVSGYDGKSQIYSFSLVDENENVIECDSVLSKINYDSKGYAELIYDITPKTEISSNIKYSIKIEVSSGELYLNASEGSVIASKENITILSVDVDEDAIGGLVVTMGGVKEDTEYNVSANLYDSDGEILYNGKIKPILQDGQYIFKIKLSRNNFEMPIEAFEDSRIYIKIQESLEAYDTNYYVSVLNNKQSISFRFDKIDDTNYYFTLKGQNILLDLYESNNLNLSLKKYNKDSKTYEKVGKAVGELSKNKYCSYEDLYYNMSGNIETTIVLDKKTTYALFNDDEFIGEYYYSGTNLVSNENVKILDFSSPYFDYGGKFYFNLNKLEMEVVLESNENTVTPYLYDKTASKIIARTNQITGVWDEENGGYKFNFEILKPDELDSSHVYQMKFINGDKTIDLGEYDSDYSELSYDSSVEFEYYHIKDKVFVGDTTLTLSSNYIKNISEEFFNENPILIMDKVLDIVIKYDSMEIKYNAGTWELQLNLSKPIEYGTYLYRSSYSFEVLPTTKTVLGNVVADEENSTLTISNCYNLTDGNYTGILYGTEVSGYRKIQDLVLEKTSYNTLEIKGLPKDLVNDKYTLEVWKEDTYISSISVDWNIEVEYGEFEIRGYEKSTGEELVYETTDSEIYLYTDFPGYAYVRYSENKNFSGVQYKPVRLYYNQILKLSEGYGEKTIYVQFKTTSGTETEVFSFSFNRVESITEPKILKAWVTIDDIETTTIPYDKDFVLNLVTDSYLVMPYANFIEENNNLHYKDYKLEYKGENTGNEGGYLFNLEVNDFSWYVDSYNFIGAKFFLGNLGVKTYNDNKEIALVFEREVEVTEESKIILDNWEDSRCIYANTKNYTITGVASPNSEVTIKLDDYHDVIEKAVTANSDGKFSVTFEELADKSYKVYAEDSFGLKYSNYYDDYAELYVDTIPPVITSLKAATGAGGNTAVTWKCEGEKIDYFFLYRDNDLIRGPGTSYDSYTDTNYIALNAIGVTFKVIAVDMAGNISEPKEVVVADNEAPTAPLTIQSLSYGTKHIKIGWEGASDNVAVYEYEVYRENEKIATVPYTTLEFCDSGLNEGTAYTYSVYALDRAGNKSEPITFKFFTTLLSVEEHTNIEEKYYRDEIDEVSYIHVSTTNTDIKYTKNVSAVMMYKKTDSAEWKEVELKYNTSNNNFGGNWTIKELELGNYEIKFKVTDTDGAVKETEVMNTIITQDMEPPVISIIEPSNETIIGGKKEQLVRFETTDNKLVKKVEIYYSDDNGVNYIKFATLDNIFDNILETTIEFKEAKTLMSGNIKLKAVAYDKCNNEGVSEIIQFTLDNTAPEEAQNFFIGGTEDKISLIWTKAMDEDIKHFNVYRSMSKDEGFELVESVTDVGYSDAKGNGLVSDTTYYYYVTTVDNCGNESNGTSVKSAKFMKDEVSPEIYNITPKNGSKVEKNVLIEVSAMDNYMLKKCVIEYKESSATEYIELTTIENSIAAKSYIYKYNWGISDMTYGNYDLRVSIYDESGNPATVEEISYTINNYIAPVAPILSAEPNGHKSSNLTWEYNGDVTTISSFKIYRSDDGQDYEYVSGVSGNEREYIDELKFDGESKGVYYKIEAIDKYKQSAMSSEIQIAVESSDSEKPNVIISSNEIIYATKGNPISFTGAACTDNDAIESYEWNFGDDNTATGMEVSNIYSDVGEYTVTLKVTDTYGNYDTDTCTVKVIDVENENSEYTVLKLKICNAITLSSIEDAVVTINTENGTETFNSNSNGIAECIVPNGEYMVSTFADGYIVRTIVIKAEGGVKEYTIGLTNGSIMSGGISVTELTPEEMIELGIDPYAPGNNHVYKFKTVLEFSVGLKDFEIPYIGYKNSNGELLNREELELEFDMNFRKGKLKLIPISETFYLVIYGEAKWLKEIYNVELLVLNNSNTDTLDNVVATLELPDGLSLADMINGSQNATQKLGNIGHSGKAIAKWFVRGDKEGEYNLTAKVSALSMPFGEKIEQTYKTSNPLKVYAGSALKLTVTAQDMAERDKEYTVKFKLENVSDKTIYNLNFGITGVEQFQVLQYKENSVTLPIEKEEFENEFIRNIKELVPGSSVEIEFSTTIWFKSIAEVGEKVLESYLSTKGLGFLGNFVDVAYYLDDISVVSLEGSTTVIPSEVIIEKVPRPQLIVEICDTAKGLYDNKDITSNETLPETLVEVFGHSLPMPLKEGAKIFLSMQDGVTGYSANITIDDGKQNGNSLQNENVSITCGTTSEMIFDTLNGVTIKNHKNGKIAISGLKVGETDLNISLSSNGVNFDYKLPITVDGNKINTKVSLGVDDNGKFNINSDVVKQIINSVQSNEEETYLDNPYLWFASHLELDVKGSKNGLDSILKFEEDTLDNLLKETVLSAVDISSDVGDMSIDRETLETILEAKDPNETVLIAMQELAKDVTEEKSGIDRPTYEFLIQVGEEENARYVSDFGGGVVNVEIPYELQVGENPEDIEIQRIKENGRYEVVSSEYDSENGVVKFTTDQFSYYRIGLKSDGINIVVKSGENGTVTPGTTKVYEGGGQEFVVKANEGYRISEIKIDEDVQEITNETEMTINISNVTKETILNVVFTGKAYTVNFESNGGSNVDNKEVVYGNTYGKLEVPVKEGYVFEGWYKDIELLNRVDSFTKVDIADNHTLYANWIENAAVIFTWDVDDTLTKTIKVKSEEYSTIEWGDGDISFIEPTDEITEISYTYETPGRYTVRILDDGITELDCSSNKITQLDVSRNMSLTKLYCQANQLVELNIINNARITEVCCIQESLTDLYVSEYQEADMEIISKTLGDGIVSTNNTIYKHSNTLVSVREIVKPVISVLENEDGTARIVGITSEMEYNIGDPNEEYDWWDYEIGDLDYIFDNKTVYVRYKNNEKSMITVDVIFYTVDIKITGMGDAYLDGDNMVLKGGTKELMLFPERGYYVYDVLMDGESIGNYSHYTISEIDADVIISVIFKKISSGGSSSSGGSGSINFGYSMSSINLLNSSWKNPFGDVSKDDWYYSAVEYVNDKKYFNGTSATEFSPNSPMTREMIVTVLYNMERKPIVYGEIKYNDVEYGRWSQSAVIWAERYGIISGYPDGSFKPAKEITREEFATILKRYCEYKQRALYKSTSIEEYIDKDTVSDWSSQSMSWAVGNGIMSGYNKIDGKALLPQKSATRAEVATMIMNYCKAKN